jgi:hypothetical protein
MAAIIQNDIPSKNMSVVTRYVLYCSDSVLVVYYKMFEQHHFRQLFVLQDLKKLTLVPYNTKHHLQLWKKARHRQLRHKHSYPTESGR